MRKVTTGLVVFSKLVFVGMVIWLGLQFAQCKKRNSPATPSDQKVISAFEFLPQQNGQLTTTIIGRISGDSIYLPVAKSVPLTNLLPSIEWAGASIDPGLTTKEDFSSPVRYTVTAVDGTTITYVVVAQILSGDKSINSFVFEAANNPGLDSNYTGIITGDTIVVHGDSTLNLAGLVPSIGYTGVMISPDSNSKSDFSFPVNYKVTAADGTTRTYTVIVSLDKILYVGSDDGNLYALDAATGGLIWKHTTAGGIRSSPTVWNGMVYFLSYDNYVYALSAADGSLKWRYQIPNTLWNSQFGSNPTVQSGILYFNSTVYLFALDAKSGNMVWQGYTGPLSDNNSPTVVNGIVYDPTLNGGGPVITFDATTGSHILNFPSGGIGSGNPTVVNGTVYSSNEGTVMQAWDAQTGAKKWVPDLLKATQFAGDSVPQGFGYSPTVYNGKVYVGTIGGAGLLALDPNTGAVLWQVNDGGDVSPAVAGDGLIYAANSFGFLAAYDAGTGAQKWQITNATLQFNTPIQPTYSNGTLYTGTMNWYVVAVDALTGNIKWAYYTGGPVLSGPFILDGSGNAHHPVASGDQQ